MANFTIQTFFQVGNLTTIRETQCLCNHLTSFGSDFVVPPNTIDFNTVFSAEKFLESLPVFTTVIVVILLYIGVMVWARREDKKDLIKVSIVKTGHKTAPQSFCLPNHKHKSYA